MRHDSPLTTLEQSLVHEYDQAGRILRGRFYGWTGERRRLPKIARSPGDYTGPAIDSKPASSLDGAASASVAKVTCDMAPADLANADTHVQLVLERSTDGGQTWHFCTRAEYRGTDVDPNSQPLSTFPGTAYHCRFRADIAPAAIQFRTVKRNLGSNSVTSDCALEVQS